MYPRASTRFNGIYAMGIFDRFRKQTTVAELPVEPKKPAEPKKTRPPEKTAKELATERGEPYFDIVSMDIDPNNIHAGSFEFDWNDKMIADLVRHGYRMKPTDTDADMVDRWFQNVCRNVVLETWEQEQAMNGNRIIRSKDIGDGRSEVS
jgi:hypothetical protein